MAYIVLVALGTELGGLHCIGDSGDRAGWLTLYWLLWGQSWVTYIVLVTLGTELGDLHCIGDSGDRAGWLTLYW